MTIIDLSLTIGPNQSEPVQVDIDYIDHKQGAQLLGKSIGIGYEEFPDRLGLSLETVRLTTHTGTHIDSPLHYGPYCEGKKSKSIGQLPLEWFYSDGVVIRLDDNPEQGDITRAELEAKLAKIKYQLKAYDIVLIQINGDQHWGKPEYFTHFRGMSSEATSWLIDQGIKVIGVDTFGFDAPFNLMLSRYQTSGDSKYLWPAHVLGRKKEYCQIERLTNLSAIPVDHGFKIACFPIKIADCGAGWARVVAIID